MNILHITILAPGRYNGGEIGVRQTLLSLIGNGYTVDYLGPEIRDPELRGLYSNTYELEANRNKLIRIWDTLHGISNQRYRSWLTFSKNFDFDRYDAIVMDFTKLDYMLEKLPLDKLIVRAHNVEADYSARNYSIQKTFVNYLDKLFAARREADIFKKIKHLIVLTKEDAARFSELYDTSKIQMTIDPVCLEAPSFKDFIKDLEKKEEHEFIILMTGSLWFGPNYEGFKWFLNNVYPAISFSKKVMIAGARPNDELKETVSRLSDCEIIDTPESMEPYLRSADMYIAPIFDGAGMKVKVAEAMSYGLPIAGTSHAFTGYETEGTEGIWCCADASEMIEAICNCAGREAEDIYRIRCGIREIFEKNYSMKTSTMVFRKVIENICKDAGEHAND